MDWGIGCYESTATRLAPAAELLVEVADLRPGEHVVDVGCGTGNAALLAAARGARVTGVDPAPRLLETARERAGASASFATGDAASLPLPAASADVLLSAFGVIFAPDPLAAAAEMGRVAAPGARIVLSAWLPRGAIFNQMRLVGRAVSASREASVAERPRFAWHDPDAVSSLLAPFGFAQVDALAAQLAFTAPSADDFLEQQFSEHPLLLGACATLDDVGESEAVRGAALELLERANEDESGAFRVTSDYNIVSARRG